MVLKDGYVEDAIKIIKQALFKRPSRVNYENTDEKHAIDFVPFSLNLWELYLDLERNFGSFQTIRSAYKRMMEIRVITPFILINYA
jgi:pre-mRNA-splicing factor SYF1